LPDGYAEVRVRYPNELFSVVDAVRGTAAAPRSEQGALSTSGTVAAQELFLRSGEVRRKSLV
jgi:hypothetical protein